jgi:hypothetical protein
MTPRCWYSSTSPYSARTAKQAFQTLVNFVKGCQDQEGRCPGSPFNFCVLAWSIVHGIAKLAIAGCLACQTSPDIMKFAELVIDQCLLVRTE